MLHPSYSDLMKIVNSEGEDDTPVVNSRYSIVMATAKRARQIVSGDAFVTEDERAKPLSTAVRELSEGHIHIMPDLEEAEQEETVSFMEEMREDIAQTRMAASSAAQEDNAEESVPEEDDV